MFSSLKKLLKDQRGVTAVEYGMIMAMIAISTIAIMNDVGDDMNVVFSTISETLRDSGRVS